MPERSNVRVLDDLQGISRAAADEFVAVSRQSIKDHGRFTVALSGGSTPKALHAILVEHSAKNPKLIDWSRVQIFFGDERHVPPDHPDSNFRMANETLLSKVPIPKENIHRIRCENSDAVQAAAQYDAELAQVFQLEANEFPRFDLILLGMGPDGHTASLFPKTAALKDLTKRVVANWVQKFNTWRVTFTRPTINNAASVMLMVAGEDKAAALAEVMNGGSPETYPVKYVKPTNGTVIWLVDRAAARLVKDIDRGK
jgi:6-phosphogluconolactonase